MSFLTSYSFSTKEQLKNDIFYKMINSGLKESTSKVYTTNAVRGILGAFGLKDFKYDKLNDIDRAEKYVKSIQVGNSRQNVSRGLLELVKLLNEVDPNIKKRYQLLYQESRNLNAVRRISAKSTLIDSPMNLWKEMKDRVNAMPRLRNIESTLDKKVLSRYMKRYLGMLYTLHPTLRPSEWTSAVFLEQDDKKTNNVVLSEGMLRIYNQKSPVFGYREMKLSPYLIHEMKEMRKVMNFHYPDRKVDYVLPKYNNGYGRLTNITESIYKTLGHKADDIRKIYASTVYTNGSDELFIYSSNAMGHGIETSKIDYLKDIKRKQVWKDGDPFQTLEKYMHSYGVKKVPKIKKIKK